MKRRFDIKKFDGRSNLVFPLLMTGLIVVILLAFSSLFPKMQENFDKNYENISITFFDHSANQENPSGKISVDGTIVYQIDSISKSLTRDILVNLKKGQHIIEISTIDDKYSLTDTIEVTAYPRPYRLRIQYNYNPSIEEYRKILIDYVYQKSLQDKNYTSDQKLELYKQVTEKINKEFENDVDSIPGERSFSFTFKDITHYPIE